MRRTGKQIISGLICLLLLTALLPLPAAASAKVLDSGTCGSNVRWALTDDGTLTISGSGKMEDYYEGDEFFDSYDPYLPPWEKYLGDITNVVIKYGITHIGGYAFHDCGNLTSVSIPKSVTDIGYSAFYGCTGLTSITIPDSVTSMGSEIFADCAGLTSVTLPKGITKIPDRLFYSCRSLPTVPIPDSVTSIGVKAFCGCLNLQSISIPEGVTQFGYEVFGDCLSLTSVTIPEGVTKIASSMFVNCSSLTSITLPKSITSIGSYAFRDCDSLTTMTIPDGVKTIELGLFDMCDNLTTVNFPASVTQLGLIVFRDCTSLTSVTFHGNAPVMERDCFEDVTATVFYPCGDTTWNSGRKANYGGNLTWQVNHSFDGDAMTQEATCTQDTSKTGTCLSCNNLVTVTFPGTATGHSFGEYVTKQEANCTQGTVQVRTCETCGTTEAKSIPGTAIGHKYDANGLCVNCEEQFNLLIYMTDTYGDSWNGSAIEVYTGDTLLTEVSLPSGILNGSAEVPYVPGQLYQLRWKSSAADSECGFKITLNGETLASGQGNSYTDGQVLCTFEPACAHVLSDVTVTPPTCTEAGSTTGTCTVCGFSGIVDTSPATGHSYVDGVCTVCHEIQLIGSGTCGDNLQWQLDAFGTLTISGTGPMENHSMPEGGEPDTHWYPHRQQITKVVIGDGVTDIGEYAFHSCTELTEVSIPETVTAIGKLAFYNCTGLTEIALPEGLTTIGNAAFRRCSNLTAIAIPDSITAIGKITFFDCTALTEVTIPESVTTIGEYAFGNCTGLTTVTFQGNAPTMDSTCFKNVTATANHPCNETWTDTAKQNYGGTITWNAVHRYENGVCTGCSQRLAGDVTGDGKLNIMDVARLYAHIKGTGSITDLNLLNVADFTGDDKINILDIASLYAHIKG